MHFHIVVTHRLARDQKRSVCIQSRDLRNADSAIRQAFGEFYLLGTFRQVGSRQDASSLHKRLNLVGVELEFIVDQSDERVYTPPKVEEPIKVESPVEEVEIGFSPRRRGLREEVPVSETGVNLTEEEPHD